MYLYFYWYFSAFYGLVWTYRNMIWELVAIYCQLIAWWANIQEQSGQTPSQFNSTHSTIYITIRWFRPFHSLFLNNIRNSFCNIFCPICVLFTHPYDWPPSAAISAPQDSWAWPSLLRSPIPSTIILSPIPQLSVESLPQFFEILANIFCHSEEKILLTDILCVIFTAENISQWRREDLSCILREAFRNSNSKEQQLVDLSVVFQNMK